MPPAGDVASVLLCDKPAGVTSHDVVGQVRRERGVKAGHAGTLDPFATGLLLVLLGRATRLQRYLMELPKTYRATARLGWRSSTGDPEGELTETGNVPDDLNLPTGRITQRVPLTSAVKVQGERLYRKAHRGEQAETPEREVEVQRAELLEAGADTATYEIECSSGTYVRTLVETLGDAYCESLRRVAIGPHKVEQAGTRLTPAEALVFMPEYRLDADEAQAVSHGRSIVSRSSPLVTRPEPEAEKRVTSNKQQAVRLTFEGSLLAVARLGEENLKPEVVLS
jgi:tRNA pseudouridine55 synthase